MRRVLFAVPLLLTVASCGDSSSTPTPEPSPPSPSSTQTASLSPSESPPPSSTATSAATDSPTGSADQPAALAAVTDLLDWTPLPGKVYDTVTSNGSTTLTVAEMGGWATLDAKRFTPGSGRIFSDGLLDDDWAVLVATDKQETRPTVATVVDLDSRATYTIEGANGGWTLDGDTLLHPVTQDDRYCLASVDLESRDSTVGYCAPPRHGFTSVLASDAGISAMTFDDSQPSCRSLVTLDGEATSPFTGVPDCKGWQGLTTEDGAVWSVVTNERRVEQSTYFARSDESWFTLGQGKSGTLTWCGDAAYWARDPAKIGAPATLMRWDGEQLAVVYRSPAGQSFLTEPRCADDVLNISALSEGGDEQVSASLG